MLDHALRNNNIEINGVSCFYVNWLPLSLI